MLYFDLNLVQGWGVITMEEIPQGAFVCELIGQYADISTLSMDKKAWQAIESCSADGDEKMRLNTFLDNHVVPISLWGAGTSHGRTPVSSILGNSDSIVGPQHDVVLIDIPDSEIVSIGLNDDSDVLLDSATATSLAVRSSSTAETGPSPITSTEGASTEEHLADIWKNQVCIDCNKFGNIARFIRHRNKDRKTKKTNSGPGSSQSQSQALLIQRLVYNNAGDRRYPKLALFAAVKILANTELLI